MSSLLYAAQIAQKGFSDLGEGIGALGDKKSDAAASAAFRETNPGEESLSESIRLGKVESGAAEQIVNQKASLNPMTLISYLSRQMNSLEDGDPQKTKIKKDINGLVSIMTLTAALKGKGKRSSGDGTSSGENPYGKTENIFKEQMKMFDSRSNKLVSDGKMTKDQQDTSRANFLALLNPQAQGLKPEEILSLKETMVPLLTKAMSDDKTIITMGGGSVGSGTDTSKTTTKTETSDTSKNEKDNIRGDIGM